MKRNYTLYLNDILDAMESIRSFVADMDYKDFEQNDIISSAVIRKLEVIGEAAKQNGMRQKYPMVPWKDMAGMRDKLIHLYFGVDYLLVWITIDTIIPAVIPTIKLILEKEGAEDQTTGEKLPNC